MGRTELTLGVLGVVIAAAALGWSVFDSRYMADPAPAPPQQPAAATTKPPLTDEQIENLAYKAKVFGTPVREMVMENVPHPDADFNRLAQQGEALWQEAEVAERAEDFRTAALKRRDAQQIFQRAASRLMR